MCVLAGCPTTQVSSFLPPVRAKAPGQLAHTDKQEETECQKKSHVGSFMDSQNLSDRTNQKHTDIFSYLIHFNGNIYWLLLNNSFCHSYRGVKDHCTVSFFTVFLTVFTSSISTGCTHWSRISISSGWVHLQSHICKPNVGSLYTTLTAFTKS